MRAIYYTGIVAKVVDTINEDAAGGIPKLKMITLTREEMDEFIASKAYTAVHSEFYGDKLLPVIFDLDHDANGKVTGFLLNGCRIAVEA